MGVSGSGKTTVGRAWAKSLGAAFIEGDECHPAANIKKMSRGEPLTDSDRWRWLEIIADEMSHHEGYVITSCSALKKSYRQRLQKLLGEPVLFIYLQGSQSVIKKRLDSRQGHFMPAELLHSQFAALEPPTDDEPAIAVDINETSDVIVGEIERRISARYAGD